MLSQSVGKRVSNQEFYAQPINYEAGDKTAGQQAWGARSPGCTGQKAPVGFPQEYEMDGASDAWVLRGGSCNWGRPWE